MNLWSTARYDLGVDEADFWRLTGRQLSALTRRHKQAQDRQQMLIGILASTSANFSMCRPDPPLTAADFMPSRKSAERTDSDVAEDWAAKFQFIAIQPGVPIPDQYR